MEDLVNIIVQNGLGSASFFFMVIYIMFDKKQVAKEKEDNNKFMQDLVKALNSNTETLKIVNDNQELIKKIQNKTNIIALNELEKDNFNLTDLKNRIILEINSIILE